MRPPIPEVITSVQLLEVARVLGVDGDHVRSLHFDATAQPKVFRFVMYELNEQGQHHLVGADPDREMATFEVEVPVVYQRRPLVHVMQSNGTVACGDRHWGGTAVGALQDGRVDPNVTCQPCRQAVSST